MRECEREHRGIPCLYRDLQLKHGRCVPICMQPYCMFDLNKPTKRAGSEIMESFISGLNDTDKRTLRDYLREKYDEK